MKIIRRQPDSTFTTRLEATARRLVHSQRGKARPRTPQSEFSITSQIEEEIALVLDQIDALRLAQERQRLSLLRQECYTDTEIMHMEQRESRQLRYSPYRFPERFKLQQRLVTIEEDRRRQLRVFDDKLNALHDRLLPLLHKRDLLSG